MKNLKKIIAMGAVVLTVGVTSITALAVSSYKTPAEAVAGITGRSVDQVIAERKDKNKTYGTMASEAGKLEEFKKEMLEIKKANLAEKVAKGSLTQEKADEIIAAIEKNQENCDGTGKAKIGKNMGAKFGNNKQGNGQCDGNGNGNGMKNGNGKGKGLGGMRLQNGTCMAE
ncbi:Protein of unknown function [Hathewaya proteolytica DSM 3090]|uniref:DUF2680 domain-containing protein n=1 Tax=Hathewaya proteolytica DSM 3090 TaxID=1121331 RepID=A0A1M6JQW0_9CLOT|nr:DUF2680 domain-containing protein [Hathewaya proteolytica]SHJ49050.1 Protein of unknown function [Hathewaya proteolytica DSM 3090]